MALFLFFNFYCFHNITISNYFVWKMDELASSSISPEKEFVDPNEVLDDEMIGAKVTEQSDATVPAVPLMEELVGMQQPINNVIKKPLSKWLIFSNETRGNLWKANPTLSFSEVAKLLGETYHMLSPEENVRLEHLAKLDKERYLSQMSMVKGGSHETQPGDAQRVSTGAVELIFPLVNKLFSAVFLYVLADAQLL